MATSPTDIANQALGMVGNQPITSIDDASVAANLCARFFPRLRDELLRNHPWKFAMRRASLPASDVAPVWSTMKAFPLPADCLRLLALDLYDPDIRWQVEGGNVVAELDGPLDVLYTARVEDVAAWDATFTSAMCARLAMELAMPLAQSGTLRQQMESEYRRTLREARSLDSMQAAPGKFYADQLVDARRIGVNGGWTA